MRLIHTFAVLLAVLLSGSALLWAPDVGAATRDFYFARLGSERGLGQNSVNAIAQDAQGFVWVGTQGGLHRYDGQRYQLYRNDPRDPGSLPDSYITALAMQGEDALWVGTYSQFAARLDLRSGRIDRFTALGDLSADRQVAALLPAGARVWVGTLAGLQQLDPATGQTRRVLELDRTLLRNSPPQHLLARRDGGVWYGSAAGLYRVSARGASERIGPAVPVRSLAYDHRGQLWVGRSDGLWRLHSDGRSLVDQTAAADAAGAVRAIVEAPDRALWLSVHSDGLRRYLPDEGKATALRERGDVDAGLQEDTINALMIDRSGLLWVGGQFRGISVTDPRGTRFTYIFDSDTRYPGGGAADDSVRAVLEVAGGDLLVGTDDARLLRYSFDSSRFDDVSARLPALQGTRRRVMALAPGSSGRVWVATTAGLFRLDPDSGPAQPIALGEFTGALLRSLMVARNGDVWVGTNARGALRYRPATGEVTHYGYRENDPRQLSHPTVHAMVEDRLGRVWFGTGDGLDVLQPASGHVRHYRHSPNAEDSLPGNLVRSLHESADGTVWIGTHAGLSRAVESAAGRISFVNPLGAATRDRAPPVVFSIVEAPAGRFWLGTDVGIVRFNVGTEQVRYYGVADGLQDLEFNGGAATRLADGRIAIGGVRGLNVFDPRGVADSPYVPPVRLLSMRIGADAPAAMPALSQPSRLDVAAGADILRLRIGALDFAPDADIRYRYRMDGFDLGWIDNGAQQDVTYTRLPPGDYLFRAQATNRDGVWSTQELRVPVHIAPPWWRHPGTIAAAVLAGLALALWLAVQWRERRQRERGYFEAIREREERLKLALWASGEQFWDYDLATQTMHRMRADDQSGTGADLGVEMRSVDDHEVHRDDQPRVAELMRQHLRGSTPLFLSEHRVRNGDGQWSWVRARGRVVERDDNGRALRVAGTARDITASRSAERERRISSEVLRSMAEAVAVFDRDFVFVSVNPAFTRMTGYGDTEVIGLPTSVLDSAQHDPDFYQTMRGELERNGRWSGEIWQQRKDGQEFLCWLQASIVLDAMGQRSHYVAVLGDITDQKRAEQELRYLANYDTLTSLPNRTLLSERLSRAIVRARRQGSKIAVLFLDLDRFKDINDSLGHAAGDRILRATAARLQQTVGPHHTVARLGGDEFTIVAENIASAEDAVRVARNVLAAFEEPLDVDERHDVSITPSIGISLYPDHAQVPTDLLKHADTAMYQAKSAGRRTYMAYTETMDVDIRRRATISAALRKVLDRNELRLVFQPKLSLRHQRITGVEALLRWSSAEHGEISPAQFIPLAEESGLILDIGEWALREACSVLKHWRQHGLDELTMAVNVSALQLLRSNLPKVVARALIESGVPAEQLQLELTESVIMANAAQTAATLQGLRSIGVSMAIDDFGTGYSSLAYLKRLPINTLKIDKEFVDDLTRDPDDEAITTTVITMAHSLGLTVVAEGVETEAQMNFLRDHGCDEIQGYWLARPLEAQHCLAFIRTWSAAAAAPRGPGAAVSAVP